MSTELRKFLHEQIPLSKAMEIDVRVGESSQIEIYAPLKINSNHMETAFGGSLTTSLILACYAYLFHQLSLRGYDCRVLIKSSATQYLKPVCEDLRAVCDLPGPQQFENFLKQFDRRGVARMTLTSFIKTESGKACTFSGEFVAQKAQR